MGVRQGSNGVMQAPNATPPRSVGRTRSRSRGLHLRRHRRWEEKDEVPASWLRFKPRDERLGDESVETGTRVAHADAFTLSETGCLTARKPRLPLHNWRR